MNEDVIIPISPFERIEKILYFIYDNNKVRRRDLPEVLRVSRSVVSSSLPILIELKLVDHKGPKKESLFLTGEGLRVVENLRRGEILKVKEILLDQLSLSPALEYAYLLINQKLTPAELGHKVAKFFHKEWKTETTYKSVGRSLYELLAGFGIIDSKGFKKQRASAYAERRLDVLKPSVRYGRIANYTKKLSSRASTSITTPFEKNHRKLSDFKNLIDLGIAEDVGDKELLLTNAGIKFKESMGTTKESGIFRGILFEYKPALDVVKVLSKYHKFGIAEIGEEINKYNNTQWAVSTEGWYAKNFLTWTKKAGIVEQNGEYGKYKIVPQIKSMLSEVEGANSIISKLDDELTAIVMPSVGTKARPNAKPVRGFQKPVQTSFVRINGEFNYIKDEMLKTFTFNVLPEDEQKIKTALSKIKDKETSERRLLIDSIGMLIDTAYKYQDIEQIKKASKILLELEQLSSKKA